MEDSVEPGQAKSQSDVIVLVKRKGFRKKVVKDQSLILCEAFSLQEIAGLPILDPEKRKKLPKLFPSDQY